MGIPTIHVCLNSYLPISYSFQSAEPSSLEARNDDSIEVRAWTGGALRVSLWELGGGFTGYNLENFLGAYGAN